MSGPCTVCHARPAGISIESSSLLRHVSIHLCDKCAGRVCRFVREGKK